MEKEIYLVVVAGGKGTRMGYSQPKQFLRISGKAILQLTIEKFLRALPELKVVTVLPKDYIEGWKQYCYESNFIVPQTLVEGGITRFHSVRNALVKIPDGAVVAVHDGVRPMISEQHIRDLFNLAMDRQGVVPVLPCVDTIKVLGAEDENGLRKEEPNLRADRSVLFAAQTPQLFQSSLLKKAYACPYDTSFTDDASVAMSYGLEVSYTKGERSNIKITTPDDLRFAKALME